jgi:hypothetical protein
MRQKSWLAAGDRGEATDGAGERDDLADAGRFRLGCVEGAAESPRRVT